MMKNKPAFPHELPKEIFAGMSILEYYAGHDKRSG